MRYIDSVIVAICDPPKPKEPLSIAVEFWRKPRKPCGFKEYGVNQKNFRRLLRALNNKETRMAAEKVDTSSNEMIIHFR